MHPFQWCNGCFCGLGLVYSNKSCTMPPITFQDLPLNIYMVIFGTGIFVFILSLIFCCYFISKLRHQAQSERFGYREVVLKGDQKKLNLHGQTCAQQIITLKQNTAQTKHNVMMHIVQIQSTLALYNSATVVKLLN
ncbi:RING finger protein 122 isoform X3 [Thalassophryne amazonica]|uniref:RING finger protein 122 isoform X3 n=1 Tax=Thalassophryne amazonica TaxID=390379 RepID=UPI0014725778|nr:RING finger protein 122 isoform X3 [Thalassophryne amazonica]